MSTFEQFTAGIPLIFPSKEYFLSAFSYYYHKYYWNKEKIPRCLLETISDSWWAERADFYNDDMKDQITFFNSMEELNNIVKNKLYKIPDPVYLQARKENILNKWKSILMIRFPILYFM
jgi:hypothetical protein